jgi:hypothetical protein
MNLITSETFKYSMSALRVKTLLLLDVLLFLTLFVRTLMYLEPKRFVSFIFYNGTFPFIKILADPANVVLPYKLFLGNFLV